MRLSPWFPIQSAGSIPSATSFPEQVTVFESTDLHLATSQTMPALHYSASDIPHHTGHSCHQSSSNECRRLDEPLMHRTLPPCAQTDSLGMLGMSAVQATQQLEVAELERFLLLVPVAAVVVAVVWA